MFEFLYILFTGAVLGRKFIIRTAFYWSFWTFLNKFDFVCPHIWQAYIRWELKSD